MEFLHTDLFTLEFAIMRYTHLVRTASPACPVVLVPLRSSTHLPCVPEILRPQLSRATASGVETSSRDRTPAVALQSRTDGRGHPDPAQPRSSSRCRGESHGCKTHMISTPSSQQPEQGTFRPVVLSGDRVLNYEGTYSATTASLQ